MSGSDTTLEDESPVSSDCCVGCLTEIAQELAWLVKRIWQLDPDRRAIAGPGPLLRSTDQPANDGIVRDVAEHLPEVSVGDDAPGFEPVRPRLSGSGSAGGGV